MKQKFFFRTVLLFLGFISLGAKSLAQEQYSVNVSTTPSSSGTCTFEITADGVSVENGGNVPAHSTVIIKAIPGEGTAINMWIKKPTGAKQSTDRLTLTIENVSANIVAQAATSLQRTLTFGPAAGHESFGTVTAIKAYGSTTPLVSGVKMNSTTVRFTATANTGYRVDKWTKNGKDLTDTEKSLSLKENGTVLELYALYNSDEDYRAYFVPSATTPPSIKFALAPGQTEDAFIEAKYKDGNNVEHFIESGDIVPEGTLYSISVTPFGSKTIDKWIVDGVALEADDARLSDNRTVFEEKATKNRDIVVHLKEVPKAIIKFSVAPGQEAFGSLGASYYNVTTSQTEDLKSGDQVTYKNFITYTAIPADGYEVDKFTYNGENIDPLDLLENGTQYNAFPSTPEVNVVVYFKKKGGTTIGETYKVNFKLGFTSQDFGTISATANGEEIQPDQEVPAGAKVVITAHPKEGYGVYFWSTTPYDLEHTESADKTVFTIESLSQSVTATLYLQKVVRLDYGVAAGQEDRGTVAAKGGYPSVEITSGSYLGVKSLVSFTASPKEGYEVEKWTVNGKEVSKEGETAISKPFFSYKIPEEGNVDVRVHFKAIGGGEDPGTTETNYKVTFKVADGQEDRGTLEIIQDYLGINEIVIKSGDKVAKGQRLEFFIDAKAGYTLDKVMINGIDKTENVNRFDTQKSQYTLINLSEDINVVVSFKPESEYPKYALEFGVLAGNEAFGKLTATHEGKEIQSGAMIPEKGAVELRAVPNEGYEVENFYRNGQPDPDGVSSSDPNLYYFYMDRVSEKIEVSFKKKAASATVVINYSASENGTVTANLNGTSIANGGKVNRGASVTFVATPNKGYILKEWTINGKVSDNKTTTLTLVAENDLTVTAVFQKDNAIANITNDNIKVFIHNNNLVISGLQKEQTVAMYAITGQLIKHTVTMQGFNIGDLASGIYLIKLNNKVYKVVKP